MRRAICESGQQHSNSQYTHLQLLLSSFLSSDSGRSFYWLDNGPGRNLSIAKCPREKLEKENILYLTADQRRNYQIYIDKEDGKFRWLCASKEAVTYCGEDHPLVDTVSYTSWPTEQEIDEAH